MSKSKDDLLEQVEALQAELDLARREARALESSNHSLMINEQSLKGEVEHFKASMEKAFVELVDARLLAERYNKIAEIIRNESDYVYGVDLMAEIKSILRGK